MNLRSPECNELNNTQHNNGGMPDIYCGECSVWLAYGESEGLQNYEELLNYCKQKQCSCLGMTTYASNS